MNTLGRTISAGVAAAAWDPKANSPAATVESA